MTATIERVEIYPARLPMIKSFTFASGPLALPVGQPLISF